MLELQKASGGKQKETTIVIGLIAAAAVIYLIFRIQGGLPVKNSNPKGSADAPLSPTKSVDLLQSVGKTQMPKVLNRMEVGLDAAPNSLLALVPGNGTSTQAFSATFEDGKRGYVVFVRLASDVVGARDQVRGLAAGAGYKFREGRNTKDSAVLVIQDESFLVRVDMVLAQEASSTSFSITAYPSNQ